MIVTESSGPRYNNCLLEITEACPLRCGHCGLNGSVRGRETSPVNLEEWVSQILDYGVPRIIFTGGEPFYRLELLTKGLEVVKRRNAKAAVFTSAYWAESEEKALNVLQSLAGFESLYISSDKYHQNKVPFRYVHNAIGAAISLDIKPVVCITHESSGDLEAVKSNYEEYGTIVSIYQSRVIRSDVEASSVGACNSFSERCFLDTPLIDPNGNVFACHIGKASCHGNLSESPYYLGNMINESWSSILVRARNNAVYQFMRVAGPRGIDSLFVGKGDLNSGCFNSACEMCFHRLSNEINRTVLDNHVGQSSVLDLINLGLSFRLGEAPMEDPAQFILTPP